MAAATTTMMRSASSRESQLPAPGAAIAAPELPLLHRLAIVYLMLPVVVWLVGWFEWWFGIPAAALLVGALRRPLAGRWRPRMPSAADMAVLAVAAGVVLTTAVGGVFDVAIGDWTEHRTTLLELGRHPWPTYLPDPLAAWRPADEAAPATPPLLRYYLGWHMVPGLAARWLGPAALHWAVLLWTWAGVGLVALLFTRRRGRTLRGAALVIALVVLFFFSGMDLVQQLAHLGREWWEYNERRGWRLFLYWEVGRFRLSSTMQVLHWAPQHFLPAGLCALLFLQLCRQPRFLAVLGVLLPAVAFWSAFVALGLLPLLAVALWANGVRPFLRWPNLCLAMPLFAVVVLYLTAGTMDFERGWMWEIHDWWWLARALPLFWLTEFALLAVLLVAVRPALRRAPFFIVAVATLLLLSFYWYGGFNDLQLRASQPALFVLSWFCAGVVAQRRGVVALRPGARGGIVRRGAFGGLVLVLVVGTAGPLAELGRAVADGFGSFRYEHSGNTTLVDLVPGWRRQNVARDVPEPLQLLLREPDVMPETSMPVRLLSKSGFDIYLDGGTLVYVKDRCAPADVDRGAFFLHVVPADPADLPRRHRLAGFVPDRAFNLVALPSTTLGGRCLFGVSLPQYPVVRIVVGQKAQGRILWQAEATFPTARRDQGGGVNKAMWAM